MWQLKKVKKWKNQLIKSENLTLNCKICFKKIKLTSLHNLLSNPTICSNCLEEMHPILKEFYIDKVKALTIFEYNETLQKLIYQFKGCLDYELKDIFLSPFINELKLKYKRFYLLPVPSHKEKNAERGFNQVIEIFSSLNLPILENVIIKVNNELQHTKTYKERMEVIKSFKLINTEVLKNKNILIIDDVCTTGSSLKAMIKLIKPYVNKKIRILVIAKREFSKEELNKMKDTDFILQ